MSTPFGVPFEDLPPEFQESLRRQAAEHARVHDLQNMQIESTRHRMLAFLNGLDDEQINCLRGLLIMVMRDSDNEVGGFYLGMLSTIQIKFGYCSMCNTKHENVDDLLKHEAPAPTPPAEDPLPEATDELKYRENLQIYRLMPAGDGYKCTGCGMSYVSLEDRMLRDPDDCSGCKDQTRWGGGTPEFDPNLRRKEENGG